jgi:hypothetical protein
LIVLGGAMLEEPIKEGVAPKMKGSVLMCVADTEEEVLERVKKDVYWTSDVWDKEKVSAVGCWSGEILNEDWEVIVSEGLSADSSKNRCRLSRSRALSGRHLTSECYEMKLRFA